MLTLKNLNNKTYRNNSQIQDRSELSADYPHVFIAVCHQDCLSLRPFNKCSGSFGSREVLRVFQTYLNIIFGQK